MRIPKGKKEIHAWLMSVDMGDRIGVRAPRALRIAIERYAEERGLTVGHATRYLIMRGLSE